jgi:mono/diheme cytochrome c family protein
MKILNKISLTILGSVLIISCKDNTKPSNQFMPNMYEPVSYETYSETEAFKGRNMIKGQEAQLTPKGSVKRGYEVFEYINTPEQYLLAKANLKSPMDTLSISDKEKGKQLYGIYCAICHGESGNGKGKLVEREKFLGVPSYKDREITKGSVFFVITHGLNSMGSHASQLSQEERWMVTDYVMELKSKL